MSALREVLAIFDITVNSAQLDAADKKLDSFTDKLKAVGEAFAAFKLVKSIVDFGEAVAKSARDVEFNAARMEMGTDEYQRLTQVANNYGMTMEQLQIANTLFTRSLSGLGGTMGVFSDRTGQARQAMQNLHLDARQFRGQRLEQILPVIADAMLKVQDPMERVAIGLRLFGHRGRAILPMLAQGGDELRRQFAAAIPVFEELTIKSADRATISGKNLGRAWDNLVNNSFGKAVLDVFAKVADKLTLMVLWLKEMTKYSEIGKGVLAALGIAAAVAAGLIIAAWWPVLVPILAILAAFAALALIIDDLIVFMQGGDSLTGELIDKFFEKGAAEKTRKFLEELWEDFKAFFAKMQDRGFHDFLDGVTEFAKELKQTFQDIKDAIAWIEVHWNKMKGTFDVIAHGFGGGSTEHSGADDVAHRELVANPGNTAPPPVLENLAGPPTAAQVAAYGAPAATGATFNINGSIDPHEVVRRIRPVVEEVHSQMWRDALGAQGGSK